MFRFTKYGVYYYIYYISSPHQSLIINQFTAESIEQIITKSILSINIFLCDFIKMFLLSNIIGHKRML